VDIDVFVNPEAIVLHAYYSMVVSTLNVRKQKAPWLPH